MSGGGGGWVIQQTRGVGPVLVSRWFIVYDAGPTSANASCLLGSALGPRPRYVRCQFWWHHTDGKCAKKWNESGFRPPLCTYRLNWARRTSWGWWDDWDDTVLQTQDSKFEPWRSEAEHATSRSRRLPTILTFTRGWGRNIFRFFENAETGNRTPNSGVKGSGANHYPRAPARKVCQIWDLPR